MNLEDIKEMTTEELNQLLAFVTQEISKRKELAAIPAKIESLNLEYLTANGVVPGAEWVQPQGAHDAYPNGWEVRHGGKTWVSLTPGNVWEPGVSGWREVIVETPDDETPLTPAWVQPTGAHDAYAKGDSVQHNDRVWTSDVDGNVWEPGVYGWTAV